MNSGDINDHFLIDQTEKGVLGRGHFAVVRRAVDKKTGELVAVKHIDKSMVERDETLEREIEILSVTDHPRIVKLRGIFDAPETMCIVMDLLEGGELYDEIIRRETFTEKEASYVLKQLLEALDYLHEKGFVHRDLKLENLLLVSKGSLDIKVADFGLSRHINPDSKAQTACGTPFYVAPDILLADNNFGYGPAVDMWAVGVILYILLSGRLPFSGGDQDDNDEALFTNILEAKLVWKKPQFDVVSDVAKDLISHLIVADPNLRFSAKVALQHPFITDNNSTKSLDNIQGVKNVKAQVQRDKEATGVKK
jgi:serine/threonine protein kinase